MTFERSIAPKGNFSFKILLFPIIWSISKLPDFILNGLSTFIYFTLYKVLKYRVSVVKSNLKNAFPFKSIEELENIEQNYYRHLSDLFIETVSAISISRKKILERVKNIDIHIYDRFNEEKKSVVVVMSHCGNWEYICLASALQCKQQIQCVYKTLSSNGWDWLMYKIRSKFGTNPFTMENTLRAILKNKDTVTINAFVGDQNPASGINAYWSRFLNQETAFMTGPEKIAKKFNMPIIYLSTNKVKRNHYEFHSEILTENPNDFSDGEITELIIKRTEKEILSQPEIWLWSHRRWKHKRNLN